VGTTASVNFDSRRWTIAARIQRHHHRYAYNAAAMVGARTCAGTTNTERAAARFSNFIDSILGESPQLPHTNQEFIRDPVAH